jgi:PAS domain S-box-containing protein
LSLQTLSILFVEDHDPTRKEIASYLLQRAYTNVYIAKNGEEGLQSYFDNKPDIVLTDLTMPIMDGLKMSKNIKTHNPDIPILLITSLFEKEVTETAVDIGIDAYLFKPISFSRLEIILKKYDSRVLFKKKFLSEQKLLEEYKGAIDASASVTKTNTKGIITYTNDSFCKMSGYSREELIGKRHNIVQHPDTPRSTFVDIWKMISNKKIWQGKIKNLKKDGTTYYEYSVIVPILNEENKIVEYISLKQDITDLFYQEEYLKKRIQEEVDKNLELHKKREEENLLEAKFSTIGKMAAGITHEINTPLTFIKGNLEMMTQDINSLDDELKQKKYLLEDSKTLLSGVNRIADIVESMREMACQRKESSQEENIYAMLITALILSHNKAKHISEIKIQNELFHLGMKKEQFHYMANVQQQRIEQVFVIIINNALDALKHHDDFSKRLLDITLENENEFVVIRFKDNGGGISAEMLPKIFDPFQSNKSEGGMGIGLNVARRIVYDHGGKIVPSNYGDGALFEIYLPKIPLQIDI